MNGAIIPHTPIAVDFWNIRKTAASNCRLFFLSHAHSDHTVGLTSSWKNHKIYCSEVTKKIILHKLGVCSNLVVGLPVDETVVIAMDDVGKENLKVTLIDANHCPGAVLFLFQGYFGTILYTGDFRYYKSMSYHNALQGLDIDKLFLDNTYCEPKCAFPTREEASNRILEIIRNHPSDNIVIGMHSLGKENLLANIAITFKTWIGVQPKRMELLQLLDLPNVFTCDLDSTHIRVLMQREISKTNLEDWNNTHPTIAILPTAIFEGETNIYQFMKNVFVVPYSDHSSFDELVSFVSEVKPREIVPLVLRHKGAKGDPDNLRVNMSVFSKFMNSEPSSMITIPTTVLNFMGAQTENGNTRKRKVLVTSKPKKRKCSGVVFSEDEVKLNMQSPYLEEEKQVQKEESSQLMSKSKYTKQSNSHQDISNPRNIPKENKKNALNESYQSDHNSQDNEMEVGNGNKRMGDLNLTNIISHQVKEQESQSKGCNTVATRPSREGKELALQLLDTFNQDNYEDQYTVGNPVYKQFVSHFCDQLKSVVSEDQTSEDIEDITQDNTKPVIHVSSDQSSSNQSVAGDIADTRLVAMEFANLSEIDYNEIPDSPEESFSDFNWFSSSW